MKITNIESDIIEAQFLRFTIHGSQSNYSENTIFTSHQGHILAFNATYTSFSDMAQKFEDPMSSIG